MNVVALAGRIGKIETKELPKGHVTSFNLAIDDGYFDKESNKWVDRTVWVNCSLYRKSNMLKGDLVSVTGKLRDRKYQNKDDRTIYVTEVIVSGMRLLSRSKKNAEEENNTINKEPEAVEPSTSKGEDLLPDDDLPF